MTDDATLVKGLYQSFNARDMEGVIALMHPDVTWANGMEGGHVQGHSGVREYWTRQWAMIDPTVEPRSHARDAEGRLVVEVHQVVRELSGALIEEKDVGHVFQIEGGLIRRFEIR